MPSPSSSHRSFEPGGGGLANAEVEEWPLENATLKRIVVSRQVTFQLQFVGAAHWQGVSVAISITPQLQKEAVAECGIRYLAVPLQMTRTIY